ncbi:MAG: HAMP domain-containing histidine kinase [Lachnospiraceae bacterium]|nr:HAMP domain-containing histidine kinase [Lachnospiraceae bacterium]
MNKYHRILIIISALLLMGLLAFTLFTGKRSGAKEDARRVVALNAIAKDAGEHWEDLSFLSNESYGTNYVILSANNDVLYASNEEVRSIHGLEEAMKKRLLYAFVSRNGQIVGSVILPEEGSGSYQSMRNQLLRGFGLIFILFVFGAILYDRYVQKNIIRPFHNLQSFAGKVAEGHLDEPLLMDEQNMFGAFSESFDIMREQLRASREREIALQKKERELVASLSHDLKTPITGVKLTTELLKAKVSSGQAGEDPAYLLEKLDNIYKKADQIDVLVSDLFSSTLDDLGEFTVSCRDEAAADLGDIIKKYDDRGLVTIGEIPNVLIRVDIRRMGQVVGNIIVNSYKYANTKIEASFAVQDDYLQMRLRDHGPGVPTEELSLITNKFYRGKKWKDSKESGSGLGLYIAKTLMEKMDGELLAESEGEGLSITLTIPLS